MYLDCIVLIQFLYNLIKSYFIKPFIYLYYILLYMTTMFEVGKTYVYERKDAFGEKIVRSFYECLRRTEKSVWMAAVDENGELIYPDNKPMMLRVHKWGQDDEYVYERGFGNPRSCWYCGGMHLYSNIVKE